MPVTTAIFYSSSNGDRWLLSHNDETGSYLVHHEPTSVPAAKRQMCPSRRS
jgi:hypothetical protein